MIDLHSHILPGIDDGAGDLNESVAMCRRAAEQGIEAIVATPHQRNDRWSNEDPDVLVDLVRQVQEEVGDEIRVLPGGEIRIDSELVRELESHPHSGLMPLAGSRYLLLEFERSGIGPAPLDLLYDVRSLGWWPILAHPEFISNLAEDLALLQQLREAGALLQITAMSVTGDFGAGPRRVVEAMLDEDLIDIVASDAHTMRWRPPGLARARHRVARDWGEERAERLFSDVPRAVVENRPVGIAAASPEPIA